MSVRMTRSSKPTERGELRLFPIRMGKQARGIMLGVGILIASLGCALVAASQSRPDPIAARLGVTSLGTSSPGAPNPIQSATAGEAKTSDKGTTPTMIKTPVGMINAADLQRRGNSLVGEVKTRNGAVMRLVLDARTHALIGLRVLDAPK